jgi:hypothetical protein
VFITTVQKLKNWATEKICGIMWLC